MGEPRHEGHFVAPFEYATALQSHQGQMVVDYLQDNGGGYSLKSSVVP